jgi:hypothetical protein
MKKNRIIMFSLTAVLISLLVLAIVTEPKPQTQTAGQTGFETSSVSVLHCYVQLFNPEGILISASNHTMTETAYGMNNTRNLLGGYYVNGSQYADMYFCNSNDTSTVSAGWTELPSETNGDGMSRALATLTILTTGNGTWQATYTWTCSGGPCSAEEYGICSLPMNSTSANANSLDYAEQQGSSNVKNCGVGDTLNMTVTGTVS